MTVVETTLKVIQVRQDVKRYAAAISKPYAEVIKPYKIIVGKVMAANEMDNPFKALLKISDTQTFQESQIAQSCFIAAAADMKSSI